MTDELIGDEESIEVGSASFYKQLFSLYDQEHNGFITVERFISYTKENMSEMYDGIKINELVSILDPYDVGKINYNNFVAGIKKMSGEEIQQQQQQQQVLHKSQDSVEDLFMNELDRKSNFSPFSNSNDTFNEYDTDSQLNTNSSLQSSKQNALLNINHSNTSGNLNDIMSLIDDTNSIEPLNINNLSFDLLNIDDNNNNNNNNSSKMNLNAITNNTNSYDPFEYFLIDDNNAKNISLNNSNFSKLDDLDFSKFDSPMSNSTFKKLNFMSSKQIANNLYSNSSFTNNSQCNSSNSNTAFEIINDMNHETGSSKNSTKSDNDDQAIENYENKIREMTHEIEYLSSEKYEIFNKMSQLTADNGNLSEKIRELEEINIEQEKRFQKRLDDQELRHNESMAKMVKTLEYERYNHQVQLSNLEKEIHFYKVENTKYSNELSDINKKIELTDEKLNEESDKYVKLKSEFQKMLKENEIVRRDLETEKNKYKEKIDLLQSELNESQLKLQQQSTKYRGYTISLNDENYLSQRVKELEADVTQLKNENNQLVNANEDLKNQILKSNLDNGRILLHMTAASAPSLAAEIDTMSKDDIMEKYRNEQQLTKRLSDYLESILSKIMLHSPEILEININGGGGSSSGSSKTVSSSSSSSDKKLNKSSSITGDILSYRKNTDKIKFKQ